MGIRMNRHLINGHIRYNMFVNQPCYDISSYGYQYLLDHGYHPDTNPRIKDEWEHYLLKYGYLKQIGIPTKESNYDQLNYESLYNHMLG